jgi:hypothetical protein
MADARAPAFFLGLGLSARAQEGQLEARGVLPAAARRQCASAASSKVIRNVASIAHARCPGRIAGGPARSRDDLRVAAGWYPIDSGQCR